MLGAHHPALAPHAPLVRLLVAATEIEEVIHRFWSIAARPRRIDGPKVECFWLICRIEIEHVIHILGLLLLLLVLGIVSLLWRRRHLARVAATSSREV